MLNQANPYQKRVREPIGDNILLVNTVLRVTVGIILLAILFMLVERVLGRKRPRTLLRKAWMTDVSYFFLIALVTKPLVRLAIVLPAIVLVALGLASVESLQLKEYAGFGPLGHQPLWLQTVEIYVLADFLGYWQHRMFHRGRLWPFHAVHHSSQDLDWLASVRVHPVNELVGRMIQVIPLLFLGFNPWVTASTAPALTLYAIMLHADVTWNYGPLRAVVASPVFHRWHHSKEADAINKNFAGLLPVWDLIFGTYYMPKGRIPEDFGIHEPMPESLWGQMIQPFKPRSSNR